MQADSPEVIKKWDKIGVALFQDKMHTIVRIWKNAVIRLYRILKLIETQFSYHIERCVTINLKQTEAMHSLQRPLSSDRQ